MSIPRGGGKTTLAGWIVSRALTPGDSLYVENAEIVLFSGSIEQCRHVYRQALKFLEPRLDEYRLVDSATRVAITHKASRTRLKAVGSNPKTSLGLVDVPLAILDEPAALHTIGGEALWDSIVTAQGKAGSRLKVIGIGTMAPALPNSWWHRLIERGTWGTTYVQLVQGRADRWAQWREILRVNPLARVAPEMAAKLREERDEALDDERLKARFLSMRHNLPSSDESSMLLSVTDWQRTLARPVPDRDACLPIVGVDLSSGRAFSAASCIWPSGRVEAIAVCPGIPDIDAIEKRDRVPRGTYRTLVERGVLRISAGLRVPPVGDLWNSVLDLWGGASIVLCDRFRAAELTDVVKGACPVMPRTTQWSSSSEDIRALRKFAKDGPLSVHGDARLLLSASMAVAEIQTDQAGNSRLVKKSNNNVSRDDAAQSLLLAAGQLARVIAGQQRGSGFYSIRVA